MIFLHNQHFLLGLPASKNYGGKNNVSIPYILIHKNNAAGNYYLYQHFINICSNDASN